MNKTLLMLAVVSVLSFGVYVANSHAEGMATSGWGNYEMRQLLNYYVKNHAGEYLGRVEDFVIDSNGRIAFAIISQPGFLGIRGKAVGVPFEALSFGSEKHEFVLDMSREKFASAPLFDKKADLGNLTWAGDVNRYFGVQPYWTDGGGSTMKDMERYPSYDYDY
jgi:sporulation protein YlmC with PRC-barrel domain